MNNVHFSNESDEWATPQKLFDKLNAELGPFDLDTAATEENAKCPAYFTIKDSSLDQPWAANNWCNPPYSRLKHFVLKARREQLKGNQTVMLIPARTDTIAFHGSIYNKSDVEYRFIKGRVKFVGAQDGAPFPSMIVIFRPHQ